MRDPRDGNVLYPDYINVNILVEIFYSIVLQDATIRGNSVKGTQDPCIISCNCM